MAKLLLHLLIALPLYIGIVMIHESHLRDVYEQVVVQIPQQAYQLQKEGYSLEESTRWAIDRRNFLKEHVRNQGSPINKRLAELRNLEKYGHIVGPDYAQLAKAVRKGDESMDEIHHKIIDGSGKSNTEVNARADMHWFTGGLLVLTSLGLGSWQIRKATDWRKGFTAEALRWIGAVLGGMFGVEMGVAVGEWANGQTYLVTWGICVGIIGCVSMSWLLYRETKRFLGAAETAIFHQK